MKIFVDALARIPTVNVGTQALIMGCLHILKRRFPAATFVMLTRHPAQERHYLDATGLEIEYVLQAASPWGAWRQLRGILQRVDAVAAAWGDSHVGQSSWRLLQRALLLKRHHVPLILVTASVGPFRKGPDAWCARRGLKLFDRLTVRDLNSLRHMQGLGLRAAQCLPDTAFVLDPAPDDAVNDILRRENIPPGATYIGVNASIRLHHRFPAQHGCSYAEFMARLLERLRQITQQPILLIPHQIYPAGFAGLTPTIRMSADGDDRAAADLVLQALPQREGIFPLRGDYSPAEYKGILKRCEMFIGGRMHAVISAVSVGTPSVSMQDSHKTSGVMEMLQLSDHVWDSGQSFDELAGLAERVWIERQLERARLAALMPNFIGRAFTVGDLLADVCAGRSALPGQITDGASADGTVQFIDYLEFAQRACQLEPNHWSSQPLEKRWDYHQKAIDILKTLAIETPADVLEMGTMGVQLVKGSDTLDYAERWNYTGKAPTYLHDGRSIPWPIPAKRYKAFIALRVFQYLIPRQKEAFEEAKRIAENVILVVPRDKAYTPKGLENAIGITREQLTAWNHGRPPTLCLETKLGNLYYWDRNSTSS